MLRTARTLALTVLLAAVANQADAQITQVFAPGSLNGPLTTHDFELSAGGAGATYTFGSGSPLQASSCQYANCVTPSGLFGLTSSAFPDILTITFGSAVGSIGMFFGNDDTCCSSGFTAWLDAYNSGGLIGSVSVVANMDDGANQFLGLNSTAGIDYVNVRYGSGSNVGLFTYVDDVSFGSAVSTVPEPGSILLVAAGLAGVFGVARRRRI